MKEALLIRGARQLLTLRGPSGPRRGNALRDLGLLQEGAVLIRDGMIVDVGPARRIENLAEARNAVEIDATGKVVMPGFVDSNAHVLGARPPCDAGAADSGASALEACRRLVRNSPAKTLAFRGREVLRQFARHGTTSVEGKSGYGQDATSEIKSLRVLATLDRDPLDVAPTYLGMLAIPPEFTGGAGDYVNEVCSSVLPRVGKLRLARFAAISWEYEAFTGEQASRYFAAARAANLGLRVSGRAHAAAEAGAVTSDQTGPVNSDEARLLARSATISCLLPGPAFHLDTGAYPSGRALIDEGSAVALATGFNPHTSPSCSMQMMISLACLRMKLSPAEAISAATINGAHALRMSATAGSIEYGKQADLLVLDVSDYRELPGHFGQNLVRLTMKRGVILHDAEASCSRS
jgi:imidazolonepropionase